VIPVISLKNNGATYLQSVSISYWIISGASNIVGWTGNLAPQQTANVTLPGIPVTTGPQTLVVGTLQPNGQVDGNSADNNDTLDFVTNTPGELLTLSISPDNFGLDITWNLANDLGTVLFAGGPYANSDTNTIMRNFCLGDGCYVFTINDEYGDGICCTEGNGHYSLQSTYFTQIESDGTYGYGETTEFCIEGVGVPATESTDRLELWPNPSNGNLQIRLGSVFNGAVQWLLSDMAGRAVGQGLLEGSGTERRMSLQGFAEGSYMLRLQLGDSLVTRSVLINK
jgi:lysyl endopeptidase